MGIVFSYFCSPQPVEPTFAVGKKAVSFITESIVSEANECNEVLPNELVLECMNYIGFVMQSTILNLDEKCTLYELLMDHHRARNIESPFSHGKHFTYFDLLYRATIDNDNKTHTNFRLISKCQYKSNLIILFHTNYNHVFAIYLNNPIQHVESVKIKVESVPLDTKMGLFLLRSQFGHKPKSIAPKINKNVEDASVRSFFYETEQTSIIWVADLCLSRDESYNTYTHHFICSNSVMDLLEMKYVVVANSML
eukprot:329448_1